MLKRLTTATFALLVLSAPAAPAQSSRAAPEPGTGTVSDAVAVSGRTQMVVAAHPLASAAGDAVLDKGGSAIDAAIAIQMVLTLVEPQSSGIGGGAFLLHYAAETRLVTAYDGREKAPAAATPERFLDSTGEPMRWRDAVRTGLSVGVPGVVAMLEQAHREHGVLPWADLFEPAIRHAREGFAVTPRLNGLLTRFGPEAFFPAARDYFFDADGNPHAVGTVLRNPALADVFEAIADNGADAFYLGPLSRDIVEAIETAPTMAGDMTLDDLAAYTAVIRDPVCTPYRRHLVCGMGPPSSGGLAVGQTLALLDGLRLGPTMSDAALHRIAEAQKLAFADRNFYVGDSDFVTVPPDLLDPGYIAMRRQLIAPDSAMEKAEPGTPPSVLQERNGRDATRENPGTSQISVVDKAGNGVSMTTSIESAFGSRLMVRGFLLNNQLTDFSFRPIDSDGRAIANRVEAGKRPRSSMAPTLVFAEDGRLEAVLGSPGGSRIIPYVVKGVIGHVDWRLDPQQIANLPNFGSRNGPFEIEEGFEGLAFVPLLEQRGQTIKPSGMTSGLNMIVRRSDGTLVGGTDPRREGVVIAD